MRSVAKRVGHAEEKEKKEARPFGPVECRSKKQRAFGLVRRAETESHIRPVCVSSRESKTQRYSAILRGAVRVKK